MVIVEWDNFCFIYFMPLQSICNYFLYIVFYVYYNIYVYSSAALRCTALKHSDGLEQKLSHFQPAISFWLLRSHQVALCRSGCGCHHSWLQTDIITCLCTLRIFLAQSFNAHISLLMATMAWYLDYRKMHQFSSLVGLF